jgi:hypothetical protein
MINAQGDILTADHVVAGASSISVKLQNGTTMSAQVLGQDNSTDVAVLKINPSRVSVLPLALGTTASLSVGDTLAVIGNPFGFNRSLSTGVVSALDRTIEAPTVARAAIGSRTGCGSARSRRLARRAPRRAATKTGTPTPARRARRPRASAAERDRVPPSSRSGRRPRSGSHRKCPGRAYSQPTRHSSPPRREQGPTGRDRRLVTVASWHDGCGWSLATVSRRGKAFRLPTLQGRECQPLRPAHRMVCRVAGAR